MALLEGDIATESTAVGIRAMSHPERVTALDKRHLGSMTKSMTATLAARLVEQGGSRIAVEPGPQTDNPAALGPAGTVHSSLEDYARYAAKHLVGAGGSTG